MSGVDGEWLYAAGDVTGRAPLTQQGSYAARIAGDVIAAQARGPAADPVPWSALAALVGITFVGQDVAELLHTGTIALGKVPLERAATAFPRMGRRLSRTTSRWSKSRKSAPRQPTGRRKGRDRSARTVPPLSLGGPTAL